MKKKILSLFLAAAMVWALAAAAHGKEAEAGPLDGQIVILHTNDVHGAVAGYAKAAALKDAYEARGAYVLLLDAGDFIQGDPAVSVSQGAAAVELMELAGYDAACPGNHEFDYGYENLKTLAEAAQFPIVACNVLRSVQMSAGGGTVSVEQGAFDPHVIFDAPDGTRIGVFGLTTPETATKAHPAKIQGMSFLAGEELFDCARGEVQLLEDARCDYIVCLGHLGIDGSSAGSRSVDLLREVDGIDVFIDGHSHSTLEQTAAEAEAAGITDTVVTSAGTGLESVGVVTIDGGTITASAVRTADLTEEDPVVAARAAAIEKKIDEDYGAVFARTEVELNGERAPGNRTQETNLGDLICDAMVWAAAESGIAVSGAVTNGGAIRAGIAAGGITKRDIQTVLPFGNTLSIVRVTGAELLEALEASTYCTPEEIGGFPQVSCIEFTVDAAAAYDRGELYPGSTYYAPASIQRVSIGTVGDAPFDPEASYLIATNDFLAAGGDTYFAFAAAEENYDLGIPLDEIVAAYIEDYLGGVVTYEAYAHTGGRIAVRTAAGQLPFTDVTVSDPYYEDILYCYDNDLFKGVTPTRFDPAGTMNRGQMVTVLWRMSGSPEPAAPSPFTDVEENSAYAGAIAWAAENGLTNGITDTTFAPGTPISRQQFITILYRYAVYMGYDVAVEGDPGSLYRDWESISGYAKEAMTWAVVSGVLTADKAVSPHVGAVRCQIARYLTAFCQTVVPAETAAERAA